eukprot:1242390-Rhodomonas_salina.2
MGVSGGVRQVAHGQSSALTHGGEALMGSSGGAGRTGLRGRSTTVLLRCSNHTVLSAWSVTAPTRLSQGMPPGVRHHSRALPYRAGTGTALACQLAKDMGLDGCRGAHVASTRS